MDGQEQRVEWRIQKWAYNNGVCESTKYPVVLEPGVREGTRRYRRAVDRAAKNDRESVRECARSLNNNFTAGQDRYITMDYSEAGLRRLAKRVGVPDDSMDRFLASALSEGESPEQEDNRLMLYLSAETEAANFIKRCHRACRKAGVELRYIYVTSDRKVDKSGERVPVRVHHHLVCNREAAEIVSRCWTAGGGKPRVLRGGSHGDLTPTAEYMVEQVRDIPGKKRYHPSRTLEKPEPYREDKSTNPDAPLRVPSGCEFIWRSEAYAGRPQVLRYYRPPEKRPKKPKKKQGGTHHGKGKQAEH